MPVASFVNAPSLHHVSELPFCCHSVYSASPWWPTTAARCQIRVLVTNWWTAFRENAQVMAPIFYSRTLTWDPLKTRFRFLATPAASVFDHKLDAGIHNKNVGVHYKPLAGSTYGEGGVKFSLDPDFRHVKFDARFRSDTGTHTVPVGSLFKYGLYIQNILPPMAIQWKSVPK